MDILNRKKNDRPKNDFDYLNDGECPDCKTKLYFYFEGKDKPWCKKCDVYFTQSGGFVVRNLEALKQYNANQKEKGK